MLPFSVQVAAFEGTFLRAVCLVSSLVMPSSSLLFLISFVQAASVKYVLQLGQYQYSMCGSQVLFFVAAWCSGFAWVQSSGFTLGLGLGVGDSDGVGVSVGSGLVLGDGVGVSLGVGVSPPVTVRVAGSLTFQDANFSI